MEIRVMISTINRGDENMKLLEKQIASFAKILREVKKDYPEAETIINVSENIF